MIFIKISTGGHLISLNDDFRVANPAEVTH